MNVCVDVMAVGIFIIIRKKTEIFFRKIIKKKYPVDKLHINGMITCFM